jgi:hypothetical protein
MTDDKIVVADSKIGWAKAFKKLISSLYDGDIPQIDYSHVRPKGTRLKTFGGRASGPEPLMKLFNFAIKTFSDAAGRKLKSIEVHDLMCQIGEIVVVGGVRRSALISLSNLSDRRMAEAKVGQWWEYNNQRGLANNSVAYTEKPEMEIFMEEWLTLVKSKSGERGIFNREASQKQASRWGRRSPELNYGTNPCCFTGDTLVAVADGRNAVTIKQLALESNGVKPFPVYSARESTTSNQYGNSRIFKRWKTEVKTAIAKATGVKEVYCVTLSNGDTFEATGDHPLATSGGEYVPVLNSIGVDLAKFYTVKNKYRKINSITDGHKSQHRFIWEYHHGTLPEGFEIDHILNNGDDNIENLQLLTGNAHLKKTSNERCGKNNPIHRRDKVNFATNVACAVEGSGNPRWSGISDLELIDIGREALAKGIPLNASALRKINPLFPLSFSKNRFDGSFIRYKQIVKGETEYIPPTPTLPIKFDKSFIHLTDPVHVTSITSLGYRDIYDLQVEDNENFYIITKSFDEKAVESRGILVHNSEIILRDKQFCNLSEVVVRPHDTFESLLFKVEMATVLGTLQSTLTVFHFLSDEWRANTEEERLLGVSLTGIMDSDLTNNDHGTLRSMLEQLRFHARITNEQWAEKLGIPVSTAITCVKPSGTVSQLVDSASGIHARHNPYYIRRIRMDKKDPAYNFLKNKGVHVADDVARPDSTAVFSFAMKAPEGAVCRKDKTAIEQLEMWLLYQRHWCEHKPSVTISVREHEWLEVGAWVYKHFDEMSGVSFLPFSDHTYRQFPYEDISKERYDELIAQEVTHIDWSELIEDDDNTESSQTLACVGGMCEI